MNSRASKTKRLFISIVLLLPLPALAQTIYVYPTTAIAPRGSYQTVTAVVNGVNDKTVTWSASGGTLVGTNPCVVNEPCTIALYATTAGAYTLTATSNANHAVIASSTVTFTASPTPVSGHPRFMVNSSMLSALQAKATSSNVIYQNARNTAISFYTADNAIWSWTCNSGTGLPSSPQYAGRETDVGIFAYMALIDPSDPTYHWGCYARDIYIYVIGNVLNGNETFAGNVWSDGVGGFALAPDWLMAGGYLSSSDITLTRSFFAWAAPQILNYSYGYAPPWTASYNSSAEFATGTPQDLQKIRAMGNNYTFSRLMYMVATGLTFDDNTTDDPPLTNTCSATRYQICPDGTAGSLHAYWHYATGAMLYMYWAHLEDPNVSWQAYQSAYGNLPTQPACLYMDGTSHPCFGDGRGGESSEGSWYQYSLFKLRLVFNMLHTAGMDDPMQYGPQMSLNTSSWWDLKYVSDLEFLTSMALNNGGVGGGSPSFAYLSTGDSHAYYRVPNDMLTEAAILTFDSYTGRTDRSNALLWGILNTAVGGPLGTFPGCVYHCGFDVELGNAQWGLAASLIDDLMISQPAGDPVSSLPSDPRPSLPTDLYNGSFNQHQMVRSGWGSNYTLLSTYAPNALIDHEHEYAGRFDIFSNGEYITKGRTEFTNYLDYMTATVSSNTLSLSVAGTCLAFECTYGGQFTHMDQAGLNSFLHSELPSYAAAITNMPMDYNGAWNWSSPYDTPAFTSITAASRSLIYLRGPNQVVFYDRAATSSALDKAIYQVTTGTPTIAGNGASWPTQSGTQKAYLTSLLPASPTITNYGLPCPGCSSADLAVQAADWEPVGTIKVDAGTPLSTQFLSVLEWGASSLTKSPTTLVQSTAGQNFDGALIGSSLAMFERNWPATFTGTTYPASGATTHYVSDLSPNTTYSISGAGAPSTATTDTAGVLTFSATGTGNITILPVARIEATATIRTTAFCVIAACAASIVISSCAERALRRTDFEDPSL
jgi:hypothetical protein